MTSILLATHNQAKLEELKKAGQELVDNGFTLLSLDDVGITEEPEETGATFEANSLLKAQYYADIAGMPSIADDGGPMIDAVNGEPGVKSKMWMGRPATDQELVEYTLERLKGVPKEKRTATLSTVLTFYDPKTEESFHIKEGINGYISEEVKTFPGTKPGYPFRSLFIINEFNKYYDELTPEEHHQINHRYRAMKELAQKIIAYYKNESSS
jgi:XTP/dITP diphosphohydrolase